jgi:hypothetical protein
MRILSVLLALVLLVLAGLALVPAPLPAPYVDQLRALLPAPYADQTLALWSAPAVAVARALLPKAIAGLALLLFLAIVATRPKKPADPPTAPEPVELPAAEPQESAAESTPPIAPERTADADVVHFLAILQEKGRLVDFLMDDIAPYSDAQVGAAGRVLHEGCRAALLEHFGIKPIREEGEGSKVTTPAQYAPDEYRLVGRISGEPPFTGTLVHHGWRAEWVRLPRLVTTGADRLPTIAPAEVEVR